MARDVTKLQFFSNDPIDKVVETNTISITNDGNTTATGTGTGDQSVKITTNTITNPYGRKCFVRFVWSIDGTNFNSAETQLVYSYTITLTDIPLTSSPLPMVKQAVVFGINDSEITIHTSNGEHGNVSRLSTDPLTSGYTPVSRTFTIKYSLFERE